jgi:hypothetical protein
LIYECLNEPALSFHVVSSGKNIELEAARAAAEFRNGFQSGSDVTPRVEDGTAEAVTYLTFATGFGGGEGVTPEYLSSLGFPIANFRSEIEPLAGKEEIIGTYKHPSHEQWHESINLYRSDVGSSLIAPLWGREPDIFLLHFMALYALSIVVRYLPSLWYKIEHGELDHVRALLEHYVTVVDSVVPKLATERIIGKDLAVVNPGSFSAPL